MDSMVQFYVLSQLIASDCLHGTVTTSGMMIFWRGDESAPESRLTLNIGESHLGFSLVIDGKEEAHGTITRGLTQLACLFLSLEQNYHEALGNGPNSPKK